MLGKTSLTSFFAVAAGVAMLAAAPPSAAQSWKFNQEFQFGSQQVWTSAGDIPLNGNLLFSNQQLYGASYAGGAIVGPNQSGLPTDLGAIFQYAATGASPRYPSILYGFS